MCLVGQSRAARHVDRAPTRCQVSRRGRRALSCPTHLVPGPDAMLARAAGIQCTHLRSVGNLNELTDRLGGGGTLGGCWTGRVAVTGGVVSG